MSQVFLTTDSPGETATLGDRLARKLWPNSVILLTGDLGVGKTVLAQGIGAGLGVKEPVTSPTFTIVQEYHTGRIPFFHADLYRVSGAQELEEIGFSEYFDRDGVVLVEWPERLEYLLPEDYLEIGIHQEDGEKRRISLLGKGIKYEQLVDSLFGPA